MPAHGPAQPRAPPPAPPPSGHSLGGALCQLAAFELQQAYPHADTAVVTFGAPRVRHSAGHRVLRGPLPTQRAVLCHELAGIRRGPLLWFPPPARARRALPTPPPPPPAHSHTHTQRNHQLPPFVPPPPGTRWATPPSPGSTGRWCPTRLALSTTRTPCHGFPPQVPPGYGAPIPCAPGTGHRGIGPVPQGSPVPSLGLSKGCFARGALL